MTSYLNDHQEELYDLKLNEFYPNSLFIKHELNPLLNEVKDYYNQLNGDKEIYIENFRVHILMNDPGDES